MIFMIKDYLSVINDIISYQSTLLFSSTNIIISMDNILKINEGDQIKGNSANQGI